LRNHWVRFIPAIFVALDSDVVDEAPASSSDRHDDQPSEINIIGDDDNVGGSSASIEDLFDIAGDDERTTDGDGRIPLEDQSSSLGQDDQAEDSDISLEPAPAETRNEIPRDYSARPGQARQDDQESKLASSPLPPYSAPC